MKLTIVICSHNRSELLTIALNSIYNAVKPVNYNISVLVIANACTDTTLTDLEQYKIKQSIYCQDIPLLIEEESKKGKSFALNRAINIVKEGYLCFMDDDQMLDKEYFKAVLNALNDYPDSTMLCGPLHADWKGIEPKWIYETGKYQINPLPFPLFDLGNMTLLITDEIQTPPGGQVIIRRDVFTRVGKFREDLGPTGHNLVGSEDTDFFLRAIKNNEIFRYIPSIIQYHHIDYDRFKIIYLINNSFKRNRSLTIALYSKNKPPLYLWLKLLNYFFKALLSFNSIRIRFYLVRCAAISGQISGYLRK
jgi:GT2 family glycosyltransferase